MFHDHQRLDSYQNLVGSPTGNESVESVGGGPDNIEHVSHVEGYMEAAEIYAAPDDRWASDEDAERIAGDLSSDREEGDRRRRSPDGHGSGDRNESGYARREGDAQDSERGRASSGESYEDEADNALLRRPRP